MASEVHFLRIKDCKGQSAILGALDLAAMRPWIVITEAFCDSSHMILEQAGYNKALFDGSNNFYVSPTHTSLATKLRAAVYVTNGFTVDDASLAGRVTLLEKALDVAQTSIRDRNQRLLESVRAVGHARRDIELLAEDATWLRGLLEEIRTVEANLRAENDWIRGQLSEARENQLQQLVARTGEVAWLRDCLSQSEAKALAAETAYTALAHTRRPTATRRIVARLHAMRTNWTRSPTAKADPALPLAPAAPSQPAQPELTATEAQPAESRDGPQPSDVSSANASAPALGSSVLSPFTAVHQFHSGSSKGDAITNAMLLIQAGLRSQGFHSEIFVEHRGQGLEKQIQLMDSLPNGEDYFLIVHHSMGFDAFERIFALPIRKGLVYHNITPPEFFAHLPKVAALSRLGVEQLARWRGQVGFALSDSDYNAGDLLRLGFQSVKTCALLCDVDALVLKSSEPHAKESVFTILFVGRVTPSKAQLDLVAAFAAFRRRTTRRCRLVLVGSLNPDDYVYLEAIEKLIEGSGLGNVVQITGMVSDEELETWYRQADLYVSLSLHEGFCVPLLESLAYGIPVIAWPAGAVQQTLGDTGTLLTSRDPDAVADVMLAVMTRDPAEAKAAKGRGRASLQRFAFDKMLAVLLDVLSQAGAAPLDLRTKQPKQRHMLDSSAV